MNQQVEAFQSGQLALKTSPNPYLLALTNPYDPLLNRGTRLLDATLYKGAYYTYFGPVPLLCFMWPWYAATSAHAPADLTALVFGTGAFLLQAMLLCFCKRVWFKATPPYWLGLAVLAVGMGNMIQPMLRSHSTFDIPILSELMFASATLLFVGVALSHDKPCLSAWSAASLCYGLAVGSRPNFLPAGLGLVIAFLLHNRTIGGKFDLKAVSRLMLVATPGALCLAALLSYNFARFGNAFEFGNKYTLIEVDWRHRDAFSVRYLLANAYYYIFSVPRLSLFFPHFIESAAVPSVAPIGYLDYVDRVAGIIPAYPFALLGFCFCSKRWRTKDNTGAFPLVLVIAVQGALVALPLMFFIGASIRYEAEFASFFVVLAGLSVLARSPGSAPNVAFWTGGVAIFVALWTGISNFLISSSTYGYLKEIDPVQYRSLSRAFNDLSYPLERSFGWNPQIPKLRLIFPAEKVGQVEPLWVSGKIPESDFLYVYYVTPHHVQFGFESMGLGGPLSDLIPLDYNRPHDLEVVASPFLPPSSHPYFEREGMGTGAPLKKLLRLILDGDVVFDANVNYHDARNRSTWGVSEEDKAFGTRFTGKLFSVGWEPFNPSMVSDIFDSQSYGDVVLKLEWPALKKIEEEPLLSLGAKNRGQIVFARFDGSGKIQVGMVDQTGQSALGAPFSPEGPRSQVTIRMQALYPEPDRADSIQSQAIQGGNLVIVDGHIVFRGNTAPFFVPPKAVIAGRNAIQSSNIADHFNGSIISVTRSFDDFGEKKGLPAQGQKR